MRKIGDRPVRKRGYYRAIKRGEMWAMIQCTHERIFARIAEDLYTKDPMITRMIGLKKSLE